VAGGLASVLGLDPSDGVEENVKAMTEARREAQTLQALWGQSVVKVFGFGSDADGFVYMVMEMLDGETLEDYLYDVEGYGDRMSSFEMLRTLDGVDPTTTVLVWLRSRTGSWFWRPAKVK